MTEEKKQSPVEVMEGKLFDNKDKIDNGDYLIMMNSLKTLNNYKSLYKITYLQSKVKPDSDGDVVVYYDKRIALCFISKKEIPSYWIGNGFQLSESLEFRHNEERQPVAITKWQRPAYDHDCEPIKQYVFVPSKIVMKIEPLS
tara:strand:- start:45 stop:473 length:429 start_codon:yes stop_codon:yes gene_type:complete